MKFPRNARILRSQLDAAPFASVFFLLLLFLMLGALVPTPGLPIHLPEANGLPGVDKPSVSVAVDKFGKFYFAGRMFNAVDLRLRLREAVAKSPEPLTLIIQADVSVPFGQVFALRLLASEAGIRDMHEAVRPRPFNEGEVPRRP